ncbi:DNA-binding response regulator [Actinomyces sp. oral taxon 178 str. F0338]|jgi:response regulator in two-component regulatory system with phoR, regulation of Pi uptake|nr:DNA-binding response regulator [Actinomyces sp. oral taxon 178 str. F0338]
MALVNTPAPSAPNADADRPTSFEDFLAVLNGLHLSSGRIDINIDRASVTIDGRDAGLSSKEYELLAYLAAQADRAVSREELFATVWHGAGLDLQSRTVDAHVRRLRKKLSVAPDLISTVRGAGYRFNSAPTVRVRLTRAHALAA